MTKRIKLKIQEMFDIKLHRQFRASESDSVYTLKDNSRVCEDCGIITNGGPNRSHRKIKNGEEWISYCKDCKNYQDPITKSWENNKDWNTTYRRLGHKVNNQITNDSK